MRNPMNSEGPTNHQNHPNGRITRRVEGVQHTTLLAHELAQILQKDLAEANFRANVLIRIQPSDNHFLNPNDDIGGAGYVDYKIDVEAVGELKEVQHGFYSVNGVRNGTKSTKGERR